jgi:hypothetical protein
MIIRMEFNSNKTNGASSRKLTEFPNKTSHSSSRILNVECCLTHVCPGLAEATWMF